jgi:hypothetical protein
MTLLGTFNGNLSTTNITSGTLNTWCGVVVNSNLRVLSSNLGDTRFHSPGWSIRSPAHTSAQYTVCTLDTWHPAYSVGIKGVEV